MTKISLFNGYYLDVSSQNVSLCKAFPEPRFDKRGNEIFPAPLGYYSTYSGAILAFRRRYGRDKLKEHENLTIDEAVGILKTADQDVLDLLNRLNLDIDEKRYL